MKLILLFKNSLRFIFVFFTCLVFFSSCGSGGPKTVTISWKENGEKAVNALGGGYIVYLSRNSGFKVDDALQTLELSYDLNTGRTANSFTKQLERGDWYMRLKAYGRPLGSHRVESPLSEEYAFLVK